MGTISKNMSDAGFKGQFKIRGFTCAKIRDTMKAIYYSDALLLTVVINGMIFA